MTRTSSSSNRGDDTGTAAWWRPELFDGKRDRLAARARIIRSLRAVFEAENFIEVETPALQVSPGLEPHLQAFSTTLIDGHPDDRAMRYLHTSPEFAMKKLLVAGMERIYQFSRVFRNGERSATHHPEFVMAEWYRAGAPSSALIQDCRRLLVAAAEAAGTGTLRWGGHRADPSAEWEILTTADAFRRHADIDLPALIDNPADPSPAPMAAAAASLSIRTAPDDRFDDIFFRIFLERIEPHLGIGTPTVLTDYPVSMAALSRPKPEDPALADRFELYVCGMELANAFGELTNADEQRRRFMADMDLKQRLYGERYPLDDDFLAALEFGLPDSAGIALGIDRLVMLATGADHIEDVLWAPVAAAGSGR
ncbi:EF-P lysine aminoacylase EpmA [Fodinicurvata sp. EGI_FJ10296]|uniref:EF-P lysine aminoacylase EpmA n=1 Tax=Fodinicurvata sp. EGI_FJ10296 TaxID=3231908 RepID=UPI003456D444